MESTIDIPHRGLRPVSEIFTHESTPSDHFRHSTRSTSYAPSHKLAALSTASATAMPIPNAREPPPPPPLIPPRYLADVEEAGRDGRDLASQWGSSHSGREWAGSVLSVASGSSLYGSYTGGIQDRPEYERRGSSASTVKSVSRDRERENAHGKVDEGYVSLTSNGSVKSNLFASSPLRHGFQSSFHAKYQGPDHKYDKSLLQKLDARRGSDNITPPRGFPNSVFSTSLSDSSPTARMALEHRYSAQLTPLSLPIIIGRGDLASGSWTESPKDAYTRFGSLGQGYRSPNGISDSERSPFPQESGSVSAMSLDDNFSVTSRSKDGYELRVSPENESQPTIEESGLRRLKIEEPNRADNHSPLSAAGQKRRASSPPREDGPSLHTVGSASDLYRRRESAARKSPGPRFHSTSGSISSTASGPRNGSYDSTLSVNASSLTSLSSYGRPSPGGLSPGTTTDSSDAPFSNSGSLNPSPRNSISRPSHHRSSSDTRPLITSRKQPDNTSSLKHSTATKIHGIFMCDCCPKKPKKFDSQQELSAHEQEKQYECNYCRNRFKNKNEAERHQNSLHLRRHSWSCAALAGYAAAFHQSHISSTAVIDADTCGFCGDEFPRSGVSSPSTSTGPVLYATEQDWEQRIVHLQEMHKFGECNHAKKFFRADHFRQHLKHSHAGTSGKWTNMLENACMKDEPLPEPINRSGNGAGGGNSSGGGGSGGNGGRVARINEEEEEYDAE